MTAASVNDDAAGAAELPPGMLSGLRVLDLSRIFAGPAATQVLGDLGAEVIKVEDPTGDGSRRLGASEERMRRMGGTSPAYLAFNRNKRSIVLDLHVASARAVVKRIAATVDVMVHNFRPGVVERWGLDYAAVARDNPRLVYAEFSAYGTRGAMARVGANDVAVQAYSGLISATGNKGEPPVRCGTSVVDMQGSLALVSGILGALYHRERSGRGQRVSSSLLASAAHLMGYVYADYWADGTVAEPLGTANTLNVPNQAFPAADGSVIIIASGDDMWARCADALDAARLNRSEYQRSFDRLLKRDTLVPEISAVTSRFSCAELVERLEAVRVSVAKVNSVAEAADSEQLAANGGWVSLGDDQPLQRAVSSPFELSESPVRVRRPPPRLGEHAEAILGEAGYAAEEIAALRAEGALG